MPRPEHLCQYCHPLRLNGARKGKYVITSALHGTRRICGVCARRYDGNPYVTIRPFVEPVHGAEETP